MKNVFLMFVMFMSLMLTAQSNLQNAKLATTKGTYVLGLKSSNLGFSTVDGQGTSVDVGINAGYFVASRTAILLSTGYNAYVSKGYNVNAWTYSAGVKHYLGAVIPVQVDWNGATGNGISPNVSAFGVQAGYAWFPYSNFSIEPAVRYNMSLNESYDNVLSGAVGFNYFF